jgi:hypothetical protein
MLYHWLHHQSLGLSYFKPRIEGMGGGEDAVNKAKNA